ncbi:hypothetical protein Tsubulata_034778 [Turnera subulata]|uniref:Uncharacterized protein n=1 Tax=Turnera subulata TaxID=218843 RepID=A0A9Q0F9N9_9ROSI|nr:hypothetical protein Tsubulata_034778 [Turnera subulata]
MDVGPHMVLHRPSPFHRLKSLEVEVYDDDVGATIPVNVIKDLLSGSSCAEFMSVKFPRYFCKTITGIVMPCLGKLVKVGSSNIPSNCGDLSTFAKRFPSSSHCLSCCFCGSFAIRAKKF